MTEMDTTAPAFLGTDRSTSPAPLQVDPHSNSVAAWVDTVTGGNNAALPSNERAVALEDDVDASYGTLYAMAQVTGKTEGPNRTKTSRKRPRPTRLSPMDGTHRSTTTPDVELNARRVFRHSQRSLRKEARTLSVHEALSRSALLTPTTMLTSDGDEHANVGVPTARTAGSCFAKSNFSSSAFGAAPSPERSVFSHTFGGGGGGSLLSPASPTGTPASPWSPALVSDITRNFLANVERQKRQTVERLLPRELVAPGANGGNGCGGGAYSPSSRVLLDPSSGAQRRRTQRSDVGRASQQTPSPMLPTAAGSGGAGPSSPVTKVVLEELIGGEDAQGGVAPIFREALPLSASNLSPAVATKGVYGEVGIEEEEEELIIGIPEERTTGRGYVVHASEHSLRLHQYSSSLPDVEASLPFLADKDGGGSLCASPPDEASQQLARQEMQWKHEAEREAANTRAATRRHEIWRLQQRQLKAQRMLAADGKGSEASTPTPATSTPASATSLKASVDAFEDMMRRRSGGGTITSPTAAIKSSISSSGNGTASTPHRLDVNGPSSPTGVLSRKGSSSIRDVNLSARDLSMIMRLNSFDRTSSQKVVVFGTAASKDAKGPSSASLS